MTVQVTDRVVQYTANGTTVQFDVPFQFFEIEVYSNGALVDPNEYVISQLSPGLTGSVTFNTTPPSSTVITISSATTLAQETDYVENSPFPADTHEKALDRLTMGLQDLKRDVTGTANGSWLSNAGRLVDVSSTGQFEPYRPVAGGYVFVDDDGIVSALQASDSSPITVAATTQAVKSLMLQVGDAVITMSPTPRAGRVRLGESPQELNKIDWPELWAYVNSIGSPWGSTAFTFTMPTAAGYGLRFAATSATIDPDGPRAAGSTQSDLVKRHRHGPGDLNGHTGYEGDHTHDKGTTQTGLAGGGGLSATGTGGTGNSTGLGGKHTQYGVHFGEAVAVHGFVSFAASAALRRILSNSAYA